MSCAGKWGWSINREIFNGCFETKDEAISDAEDRRPLFVGQYQEPISPETFIDGEDLIDKVLCQDNYCGDWAEDCLDCSKEQLQELTEIVRRVFGEWIDKHGLRPTFGLVENAEEIHDD